MALVDYDSSSSCSEAEDTNKISPATRVPKRPALPTALSLLGAKIPKVIGVDEDDAEDEADTDNAAMHGGRIRSFKHERGNWATFVFVPASACVEQLEDFQAEAIEKLSPEIELQPNEALHLSLSRTVVLQYHQIDEFTKSLQKALKSCAGFNSSLHLVYTNEERTRTFLAVQLDTAYKMKMKEILHPVNMVMHDYRLPKFYEPPSFHVSLLWCVGDYEELLKHKLTELQKLLDYDTLKLAVNEVHCKCGNKQFIYKLR